jgi:hypothetical protein
MPTGVGADVDGKVELAEALCDVENEVESGLLTTLLKVCGRLSQLDNRYMCRYHPETVG